MCDGRPMPLLLWGFQSMAFFVMSSYASYEQCVQVILTYVTLLHFELIAGLYLAIVGHWILRRASKRTRIYADIC